jgi:hypothetical protein
LLKQGIWVIPYDMRDHSLPLPVQLASKSKITFKTLLGKAGIFLLLTTIFSFAYTQSPQYTSNQNQYFLHGLARAGYGYLQQDWLANTLDPTPLFSLIVEWSYRLLHLQVVFYLYFALLMGIYLFSLLGIAGLLFDLDRSPTRKLLFFALLVVMHSAGLRFALARSVGYDLAYVFEDGFADQRMLGPVFQPSAFGVLLVLSIYLFLARRHYLAILAATLAASVHPTYLLSAAVLTGTYMLVVLLEKQLDPLEYAQQPFTPRFQQLLNRSARPLPKGRTHWQPDRRSLIKVSSMGALALASVFPILFYVYINFGSTPAATTAQARDILVNFRIPHHALISAWFGISTIIKLLLIASALVLVHKKRIFPILLIPALAALGLTLIQWLTQSQALALIFPWRLSIFLVPLSSTILLAQLVDWSFTRLPALIERYRGVISAISLAAIVLAVGVGATRLILDFERKANLAERPMMDFVAANNAAGENYLTPVKLQDFRLATGSPVYVDFKSIPYKDQDVLEWYRRVQAADHFYQSPSCEQLPAFAREGVTHVVIESDPAAAPLAADCPNLEETYRDPGFSIYVLKFN